MPLITFSDPGFAAHAGEAIEGAQSVRQAQADEELTRARTEATERGDQDKLRRSMGDRASRERAARNLGIAVEEIAKLDIDPAEINMADDFAFLVENAPELAQQLVDTYTEEDQKPEAAIMASRARRSVEAAQSTSAKKQGFEKFFRRNAPFLEQSGQGAGGAGAGQAQHPLLTQLQKAADDPNVTPAAYSLQVRQVEGELERQTREQLEYEGNVADAQANYAQKAPGLTADKRRAALGLLAKIQHSSTEDADDLMFQLDVVLNGREDILARKMEENAREVAQHVLAMKTQMDAEDAAAKQATPKGGTKNATTATGNPGATGKGAAGKAPAAAASAPGSAPEGIGPQLVKWASENRTDRGLINRDALRAKAEELAGRPVTDAELRQWMGGAVEEAQTKVGTSRQSSEMTSYDSWTDVPNEPSGGAPAPNKAGGGSGRSSTPMRRPAAPVPARRDRGGPAGVARVVDETKDTKSGSTPKDPRPPKDGPRDPDDMPEEAIVTELASDFKDTTSDVSADEIVRRFEKRRGVKLTEAQIREARKRAK